MLNNQGGVNVQKSGTYAGWGGVFLKEMLYCTMVLYSKCAWKIPDVNYLTGCDNFYLYECFSFSLFEYHSLDHKLSEYTKIMVDCR